MRNTAFSASLATSLLAVATLAVAIPAQALELVPVASHLANPRGLGFDQYGNLYVAEAGKGGKTCLAGFPGEMTPAGQPRCFGYTGALTLVDKYGHRAPRRVIRGIPSLAGEPADDETAPGTEANGLVDIAQGPFGFTYGVVGYGGSPASREALGPWGTPFGRLVWITPFGTLAPIADLVRYEDRRNPDGGLKDSNPNGLDALLFRRVVADAGANALLEVATDGRVRTLAVFPPRLVPSPFAPGQTIPMQAVPTSVTRGPDGAFYVSQLTGFPFPVGGANVYRVPEQGGEPEVVAEGFTNIVDLAFGLNGDLYVLEIAANSLLGAPPLGQLTRIDKHGAREIIVPAGEGLFFPTSVAIDLDGSIYVSNMSIFPDTGEVLRVIP